MKDYKQTSLFGKNESNDLNSLTPRKTPAFQKTKLADLSTSFNSNSTGKIKSSMEYGSVYKGMSYEEWAKIRDQFLKTHNMM